MKHNSRKILPYIYLLPAVAMIAVFVYYPVIDNVYNSFFDWSVFTVERDFV